MDELTWLILQHYIRKLLQSENLRTERGLAANSVSALINIIQGSLRTAFNIGYAKEYLANRIKRPKSQEKSVDCFSIQEQKKIEQAVLNGKKGKMFGVLLCLYTGLRIGELLALKWTDFDMQNCFRTVEKSCHDGKGKEGNIYE